MTLLELLPSFAEFAGILDLIAIEAKEHDQTIDTRFKIKGLLRCRAVTCKNAEIEWSYRDRRCPRGTVPTATTVGTSAHAAVTVQRSHNQTVTLTQ